MGLASSPFAASRQEKAVGLWACGPLGLWACGIYKAGGLFFQKCSREAHPDPATAVPAGRPREPSTNPLTCRAGLADMRAIQLGFKALLPI